MTNLWAALLLAALHRDPTPATATLAGQSLLCATFNEREARALGSYPKTHVTGCVSATGEVIGAILTRQGNARCLATGTLNFDTGCFVIQGCRTISGCL